MISRIKGFSFGDGDETPFDELSSYSSSNASSAVVASGGGGGRGNDEELVIRDAIQWCCEISQH